MSLLKKIESCWTDTLDKKVAEWAEQLKVNEDVFREAAKAFHEWQPLRVYLSVARAMHSRPSFSLRYEGQEVANLIVKGGDVFLEISRKTVERNWQYFGFPKDKQDGFPWRWQGPRAAEFREHFKKLDPGQKGKVPEHRIESEFLKQMADGTTAKFAGTLRNIQPVQCGPASRFSFLFPFLVTKVSQGLVKEISIFWPADV